jgi:hypothetical protein
VLPSSSNWLEELPSTVVEAGGWMKQRCFAVSASLQSCQLTCMPRLRDERDFLSVPACVPAYLPALPSASCSFLSACTSSVTCSPAALLATTAPAYSCEAGVGVTCQPGPAQLGSTAAVQGVAPAGPTLEP